MLQNKIDGIFTCGKVFLKWLKCKMINYSIVLKINQKCKKNLKQKWNIKIYYFNDLNYFLYIFHAKNKAETKNKKKI